MLKLERHGRSIESLTADDNLCRSMAIKAREGEKTPQRISPFPFQQKSLIMAAEAGPEMNHFCYNEDKWRSIKSSYSCDRKSFISYITRGEKVQAAVCDLIPAVITHKRATTQTQQSGTASFGTDTWLEPAKLCCGETDVHEILATSSYSPGSGPRRSANVILLAWSSSGIYFCWICLLEIFDKGCLLMTCWE